MKRDVISKELKKIISKQLNIDNNYFSNYSYNGDNLLLSKDLKADLLDQYEILNKIEKKYNILLNDEIILSSNDITISKYVDVIYNELTKNK